MVDKECIRKSIEDAITNWMIKCGRTGSRQSSGVIFGQGEAPKFEYTGATISNKELNEIADAMAERWGLEVSIDSKGKREIGQTKFSLWDDKNKTLLRLNKIVKNQQFIDFTNNGNGVYDLDEVLRYYNELDDIVKQKTGGILFETSKGSSYNNIYDGQYNIVNPIVLTRMVYYSKTGEFCMKQVMGHEGGHASERSITQEQIDVLRKASVGKNSYNSLNLTTQREMDIYKDVVVRQDGGRPSIVSSSDTYSKAMGENKVRFASAYSSDLALTRKGKSEDFAETMSAVSYRNVEDKSGFEIEYSDGRKVGYDEFVNDHQATFKVCCDYVDGKLKI